MRTLLTKRLTGIFAYKGPRLYSRFEITYKDEDPTDCNGRPLKLDGWFSDARDLTGDMPRQSLVRRIKRLNVDEPEISRTLRCLETHHEPMRDGAWGEPEMTGDLVPFDEDGATVLPTNVNGDGRTDLLVIRTNGAHQVLVSQGRVSTPFRADETARGVTAWKGLLDATLDEDFFDEKRGWLILDVDRNGYADLLHETTDATPGDVRLRTYAPRDDAFASSRPDLLGCDLRFATTGDVDGDGFPDLIRRAHAGTGACPARWRTRWLRNLGHSPWFDRGPTNEAWQDLAVPLEDPEAAGLEIEPPDLNPDWTPQLFAGDQARFTDVNGDGIVDVAYAFHARWEKRLGTDPCPVPEPRINEEPCQWRPVDGSIFSRIYWGDGYGAFFDSGLAGGWPILNHLAPLFSSSDPDQTDRYIVSLFSVQDLDRSGSAELLTTNDLGAQLDVHHYRGARIGFSTIAVGQPGAEDPANLLRQTGINIGDHPHAASDCDDTAGMPILADFDGDGFPDILEFRHDPEGIDGPGCFGQDSCATIRFSSRETVQGRVTSSDGAWGGRTKLDWKFTGERTSTWFNPELYMNVEALERANGAEGAIELGYHHGAVGPDGFAGFGLTTRRNARGGVDAFALGVTPPLADQILYAARYRTDGALEKLTVNVHGEPAKGGGLSIDVEAPFFNPRIRRCDYEVERNTPAHLAALSALVRRCYGWGERKAPSNKELWGVSGLERHASAGPGRTLSEIAWGEASGGAREVELTGAGGVGSWDYWVPYLPLGAPPVTWRWTAPEPIPEIPDAETVAGISEPAAEGSGWRGYVIDWEVDRAIQRVVRIRRHRSVETEDDDLVEKLQWASVDGSRGHRLTGQRTQDGAGSTLSTRTFADFAGFQDPGEVVDCGRGGGACLTTRLVRRPNGELESRSVEETGEVERWESAGWCGRETYTNPIGEERVRDFDDRCRPVFETWRGVTRTSAWDGFNRPERLEVQPNGDAVRSVTKLLYDDAMHEREDRRYVQPRSAMLRDGVLDLLHFDGFGRPTQRVRCARGQATVQNGNLRARCARGSERRVLEWNLYGTDGETYARADPHDPSEEAPVFTLTPYRDGSGRPFVTLIPDNSAASEPGWIRELAWRAPGRDVTRDALGRVTVTTYDTLSTVRRMDGRQLYRIDFDAAGRVVRREEPNAPTTLYGYDARARLASSTYEDAAPVVEEDGTVTASGVWQRGYQRDLAGRVLVTTEPNGLRVDERSDAIGRPLMRRSLAPDGTELGSVAWRYEVDADGRLVVTFIDDLGAPYVTTWDGLDRIVREETPQGVTRNYAYDPRRRTVEITTDDGGLSLRTLYSYDAFGGLARHEAPDGTTLSAERDGAGRIVELTDETGATHALSYRFSGAPFETRLVAPVGGWLIDRSVFDSAYRLVETNSGDVITRFEHDELDRPVRRRIGTKTDNETLEIAYQGLSRRPASVSWSATGFPTSTTTLRYDAWHRESGRTNPEPGSTEILHDVMHRPRLIRDEEGFVTKVFYDLLGRPVAREDPRSGRTEMAYSDLDRYDYRAVPQLSVAHVRRVGTRTASGATSAEWRDSAGRLVALRDADGLGAEYVYSGARLADVYRLAADAEGAPNSRVHYAYDEAGRLAGAYGPAAPDAFPEPFDPAGFDGYSVLLEQDAAGRVTAVSAAGERTEFAYDPLSGLLASERFGNVTRAFLRAEAAKTFPSLRLTGEMETGLKGAQRRTGYEYDARGRLISRETVADGRFEISRWEAFNPFGNPGRTLRQSGSEGRAPEDEIGYRWTYDLNGRPTRRVLEIGGDRIGASLWEWLENGALAAERAPFGRPVAYDYGGRYDAQLDSVTTADDGMVQARIVSRDAAGRTTDIDLPDARLHLGWTPSGRLTEQGLAELDGTLRQTHAFGYDAQARLASIEVRTRNSTALHGYSYDDRGFLTSETLERDGAEQTLAYRLNSAGGRVSTLLDGTETDQRRVRPVLPRDSCGGGQWPPRRLQRLGRGGGGPERREVRARRLGGGGQPDDGGRPAFNTARRRRHPGRDPSRQGVPEDRLLAPRPRRAAPDGTPVRWRGDHLRSGRGADPRPHTGPFRWSDVFGGAAARPRRVAAARGRRPDRRRRRLWRGRHAGLAGGSLRLRRHGGDPRRKGPARGAPPLLRRTDRTLPATRPGRAAGRPEPHLLRLGRPDPVRRSARTVGLRGAARQRARPRHLRCE